jgi:hypothetical protein
MRFIIPLLRIKTKREIRVSVCKGEGSTTAVPFYGTVALPDHGSSYRTKHVVTVKNK